MKKKQGPTSSNAVKSCQVVSDFRRSSVVSSFNQANEMIISSVLRKVEKEYSLNNIIIIIFNEII